jgi:hypothetical protein
MARRTGRGTRSKRPRRKIKGNSASRGWGPRPHGTQERSVKQSPLERCEELHPQRRHSLTATVQQKLFEPLHAEG